MKRLLLSAIGKDQTEQQVTEYLDELAFLAETAGARNKEKICTKIACDSRTFIGKGKLEEIKKEYIQAKEIDIAIFDDELSGAKLIILKSFRR